MNLFFHIKSWLYNKKVKSTIQCIEGYKEIDGWLSEKEAYGLYYIASKINSNGIIVEIGSWKGKSTYCLAKGLKNGKIYAIDPFNAIGESGSKEIYEQNKGNIPLYEQFKSKMLHLGVLSKIEPLQGYSNQFIKEFSKIDFLFIDGDHSIAGCDHDYLNYSPLVSIGGFIAFHDYDPNRDELGPTWVIKNRVINNPDFKFLKLYDSLWVAQKS